MMVFHKYIVTLLLLNAIFRPDAQTITPSDITTTIHFTDLAETYGGTVSVASTPPKDPLSIRPRLVMSVSHKPVRTDDDLFVVGLGFLAWRDKESLMFQIQSFVSSTPLPSSATASEIVALRRRVLLTRTLRPDERYPLKELELYGYPDIVVRAESRRK